MLLCLNLCLHRNVHLAGRTLQENDSLPINDSNSHLVHLCQACKNCRSWSNDCFLSDVMLASIEIVLIWIPRNVKQVVGPSTLDGFTGALILSQNVNMVWRLLAQMLEFAGPAVRKSSR